jgi:hypothetical protein
MDILKMALYERITTGKITPTHHEARETAVQEKDIEITLPPPETVQEEIIPTPIPETPKIEKIEPEKLPEEQKTITTEETTNEGFTPGNYLAKIQELGFKATLLPLLRTASIVVDETTITIRTTAFAKTRCTEVQNYAILEQAATYFSLEKIIIEDIGEKTNEVTVETETAVDMAASIFG